MEVFQAEYIVHSLFPSALPSSSVPTECLRTEFHHSSRRQAERNSSSSLTRSLHAFFSASHLELRFHTLYDKQSRLGTTLEIIVFSFLVRMCFIDPDHQGIFQPLKVACPYGCSNLVRCAVVALDKGGGLNECLYET